MFLPESQPDFTFGFFLHSSQSSKVDRHKEQAQAKQMQEEQLKAKFQKQFEPLTTKVGSLMLPKSLTSYERAMAHEVATQLGLKHESVGEGTDRQLRVWSGDKGALWGALLCRTSALWRLFLGTLKSLNSLSLMPSMRTWFLWDRENHPLQRT